MMNIFKKKTKPVEEPTTLSKEALTQDKDKDGVADYLQRENYASIVNTNKDFLRWESDVETEIEQYIMGLMGYSFNVTEGIWKSTSPPLMNSAGINFMKTMLRTVINKHSINTFLSGDDAHTICLYHTESLVKNLKYRKNVYAVHLADLNAIVMGFDNLSYIILSRAVDDKQRDHNDKRLNIGLTGNSNGQAG